MIRRLLLLIALGLLQTGALWAAAPISGVQTGNPGDPYYCPPGAKYCPVPGRDNTLYLDTHFGMDAATGEIKAYKGTVHPDEVTNNLTSREEVLLVAPNVSVENRHVPWPGTESHVAPATAQPDSYSRVDQALRSSRQRPAFVQSSEVAHQQSTRIPEPASSDGGPERASAPWWNPWAKDGDVSEDNRIPWWKGGLWRNRGGRDEEPDPPPRSSSRANDSRRGPDDQAPPVTPDDMWGDDDYNAYNPQFAAPDASWETQQPPQYQQPPLAQQAPYSPQYQGGFVNEPYTLPNSPPPSSPYAPGYVYPGTNVSYDNTYQGGYPASQPAPQYYNDPYASSAPAPAYGGDPYAAPVPAPTYPDPYSSSPAPAYAGSPISGDPFASPDPASLQSQPSFMPPPPAPSSAVSATGGGPQFDNAVRMVKESRFSEAKSILLSETSSNPGHAAAWRWLGDCHYNLLELAEAVECYQRALQLDPNDYYAVRGQGFANLHRGHELWRKMMEDMNMGQREQAASTFSQAHDNYKKALEMLGDCLRRAPNDGEAVYGEAMAAEGASRKLYSNAISYIKLGPENRERAELFAENCLQVINKGVERAGERAKLNPGEVGPRALLGGLYLRKAMLYHQLGKRDLGLAELVNSHRIQKLILDEIDKNNATAMKGVQDCQTYWNEWGGSGAL